MFPCLARPTRRSSLSPTPPLPTEALEQAHTSLLQLAGSNFETYSAGGGGGTAWADDVANRAVSGLQVWSDGDGMRQIQIEYTGGVWGAKHGSEGGSVSYWTVPQGQTVTSVSVWVQNKSTVRAIQFTSGTTSSPVLGKTTNFTKATYTPATAGDALMAVTGRAGGAVDQLSFTFGPATALTPIVFSKTFGGSGGGAFADNLNVSIPAKLTGFTGSADWKLQSFTASFGGVSAAKHGGNSGSEVTPFLVPEGDYVTQVKVYYDSGSVYGLQFFTKKNVASALFGGTNGSSSSTEMVSGTKEAPVLAVIVGRSGGAIDQIQFGFTPLVADKYVLKNIAYGIPVVQEPTPVSLGEASARNLTSQDQEANLTITTSITETSRWEESNSVTIGVSTSVEAEAGVVFASAKTTFTMSSEWSGSWTTGGEHSKTVEYSVSQTVSVAPGKCITGTLRGSMAKATIPWTATKVPVLKDQEVPDGATSATGVLKCATVGKYVLEWTEASA